MVFDKLFNVIAKSQRGQRSIAVSNTQISVDAFASKKVNSMQKGQLSIEFILILLVIIILISAIVLPLRDYAENSVSDIIAVQTLEKGVSDLQQAVSNLQNYSEGKIGVKIHIPEDTNLYFFQSNKVFRISYKILVKSEDMNEDYKNCKNSICSPQQITLININGQTQTHYGPKDLNLFVVKDASGIKIQ